MQERRDYAQAQACLEEALPKVRVLGERPTLAWALLSLGRLALYQQDAPRAITWVEESLIQCRAMGEKIMTSVVLTLLAQAESSAGQPAPARTLPDAGLASFQALGHTLAL